MKPLNITVGADFVIPTNGCPSTVSTFKFSEVDNPNPLLREDHWIAEIWLCNSIGLKTSVTTGKTKGFKIMVNPLSII